MDDSSEAMLRTIRRHVADTAAETGVEALSPAVLAALGAVPRDRFVPAELRRFAWDDRPLPIGHGQTISQPFIVALMTELVRPRAGGVALEVGAGCGYQSAVLAACGMRVFGIEIVEPLAERAAKTLAALGVDAVDVRAGDGFHGWPEHAPFDAIVVTAAGPEVPGPLAEQLRVGARMVLPLETRAGWQELTVVERTGEQDYRRRAVLAVRFVPLTRLPATD